jgi:hypothetical protein
MSEQQRQRRRGSRGAKSSSQWVLQPGFGWVRYGDGQRDGGRLEILETTSKAISMATSKAAATTTSKAAPRAPPVKAKAEAAPQATHHGAARRAPAAGKQPSVEAMPPPPRANPMQAVPKSLFMYKTALYVPPSSEASKSSEAAFRAPPAAAAVSKAEALGLRSEDGKRHRAQ